MATELILIRHGHAVRINEDYFHAPLTQPGQEHTAQTDQYFSTSENHLDCLYCHTHGTVHIFGVKIGLEPELQPGVKEVMFFETSALAILKILSITDLVEDYLDARAGISI